MAKTFNLTIASAKFLNKNAKKVKRANGKPEYKIEQFFRLKNASITEQTVSGNIDGESGVTFYDLNASDTARQILGFE